MGDKTKIEWTDATWNPVRARNLVTGKIGWHCEHESEGCRFCYAAGINRRLGTGLDFKPGHRKDIEVFLDEKMLLVPLRWKRPRTIFVCSMTDLFAGFVKDEWIDRMFAVMALCPQHRFQVLTKRAKRMREYSQIISGGADAGLAREFANHRPMPNQTWNWPLPNVWLGVSAEDQERADKRIPDLLATPAAVRFVSLEPLLSSIDLSPWLPNNPVHEDQAQRGVRLPSGDERRSGDYAGRDDLASSQTGMGPLAEEGHQSAVQTSEGGKTEWERRRIFSGRNDVQQRSGFCSGPSFGISPFQRSDPQASDCEPQRREEEAERSEQFGTGDSFGTTDSRTSCTPSRAHGSERSEERHGETDAREGNGNSPQEKNRRTSSINRRGLRSPASGNIEDRARRPVGKISWCIVGGESGQHARPMHPDWARSLRDQCAAADVPYFFKQWGQWHADALLNRLPDGRCPPPDMKIGKKRSGRLLDGVEHNGMPA